MRPLQGTMMGSAAGTLMLVVTVLAESARASCVVDAGNASWYGELSMTTKFGELGSAGFCLQSADNNLALLVTMKGDWGELKAWGATGNSTGEDLSLIHISEPTRLLSISYAVFCLKKKKKNLRSTTNSTML
eukprot:TRINITY_DN951_c0_g1_i17.p2 TRINITY_DN951_c0_g1~~TRINITY_DN951_c0_g1_i17.p2  ORF type:complete len:132 (+),score=40.66 TRINITY_DN951_c0_g1_i17:186-581(+)